MCGFIKYINLLPLPLTILLYLCARQLHYIVYIEISVDLSHHRNRVQDLVQQRSNQQNLINISRVQWNAVAIEISYLLYTIWSRDSFCE